MKSNQESIKVRELFDGLTGEPCPACHGKNQKKRRRDRANNACWFANGCVVGSIQANAPMSEETFNARFQYVMELLGYRWEEYANDSRARGCEVVGGVA